jgi:carboxypeptidase C (cathepsin A)
VYPEYEKTLEGRSVYLAGWSYAGKFIPLFSKHITEWSKQADVPHINFAGALIGNPLTAPAV